LEATRIIDGVGEGEEVLSPGEFSTGGDPGGVTAAPLVEVENPVVGPQASPEWSSLLEMAAGIGGAAVEHNEVPQGGLLRFADFEVEGEVASVLVGLVPRHGQAAGEGPPRYALPLLRAAGVFRSGW